MRGCRQRDGVGALPLVGGAHPIGGRGLGRLHEGGDGPRGGGVPMSHDAAHESYHLVLCQWVLRLARIHTQDAGQ